MESSPLRLAEPEQNKGPTPTETNTATCVLAGNNSSSSSTSRSRLSSIASCLSDWILVSRPCGVGVGVGAGALGGSAARARPEASASAPRTCRAERKSLFELIFMVASLRLEPPRQEQLKDIGVVRIQPARAHVGEIVVRIPNGLVVEVQGDAAEVEALIEQLIAGLGTERIARKIAQLAVPRHEEHLRGEVVGVERGRRLPVMAIVRFDQPTVAETGPVCQLDGLGEPHYRSEEHTSELQSLTNLVCRLLLENKHDLS